MMSTYYHVCTDGWDEGNLYSLNDWHDGDWKAAQDEFEQRWPDCGGLACGHIEYVHLHDTLEQAQAFQAEYGGDLLQIDINDAWVEEYIIRDDEEYDHAVCTTWMPSECITRITSYSAL